LGADEKIKEPAPKAALSDEEVKKSAKQKSKRKK
jgi:hypothetical protein